MTGVMTHQQDAHVTGPGAPVRPGRLAWLVTLSLATGVGAAALFAVLPFVAVEEGALTGAVLCGFATGWAVLWILSVRLTDYPQQWAAAPAVFMGVGGVALLTYGDSIVDALTWVWPPALFGLVVWATYRTRHGLPSRAGRVQLYVVFSVLAAAAVGGGYQAVGEGTDPHALPATGRLVDVGGHRLFLRCVGTGSPTVVLEPGAGGTSAQLGWITPAVARSTRVCVYDRAGRGWSEASGRRQDGAQIATDLHTLLHRAGEPGPYVLAGHSFGGLYVRIFAAHYPDEVAGLVLVDSTAAGAPAMPVGDPVVGAAPVGRVSVLASLAGRVGLARVLAQMNWGELPATSRDEVRASNAQARWVTSTVDEYARGADSAREAASLRDFGDKPLYVVTAGEHPASWMTDQEELLALSTNSVQRVAEGATHVDLVIEESYAAVTARAVLAVVAAVRNGQPLTD